MRQYLFCVLLLVAMSSGTRAACVDPSTLVRSTVNISRDFDEEEQRADPGVLGIRGTAWFLSPRLVVTAAHVADAMHLSAQEWKEIGIQERASRASRPARLLRVAGTHQEKIAVLELSRPFPGATVLRNRMGPLVSDEPLASLAYPGSELRFAGGRFVEYGEDAKFAGMALLEMFDGNDRLVLSGRRRCRHAGPGLHDCDRTEGARVLDRAVRQEPPRRSQQVPADLARLR
jgi:hypothetical protein